MCWLPLTLGTVMLLAGAVLVARFFVGRGAAAPQRATLARNESMLLGTALVALGLMLLSLGLTGVLCSWAGIS